MCTCSLLLQDGMAKVVGEAGLDNVPHQQASNHTMFSHGSKCQLWLRKPTDPSIALIDRWRSVILSQGICTLLRQDGTVKGAKEVALDHVPHQKAGLRRVVSWQPMRLMAYKATGMCITLVHKYRSSD